MRYDSIAAGLRKQLIEGGKILFAVILALVVGGLILLLLGASPIEVYSVMLVKSLSSFDSVLRRAMVLMLSGLAVAIPMKSGMLNMGGEGQIAAGGLVAALIGSMELGLPLGFHVIVAVMGAALTGIVLSGIPALLSLYRNANEVVVTIMMNNILSHMVAWLVTNPFRGTVYSPQTANVLPSAQIPRFGRGIDFSWGLIVAVLACVAAWVFLERSPRGLELKASGLNPIASRYQGINIKAMSLLGMLLGGIAASTGGALEVLGGTMFYKDGIFLQYGFDGVAIAFMARGNPVGIIFTSLFFSMVRVGALAICRKTGISTYFVSVLQGLIIAFLVVPYLAEMLISWPKKIHLAKKKGVKI